MAGEIVASEKQFQEYAEKLGGIANDAASKIIDARDKTSRELVLANERMKKLLSSLESAERQRAALSSLSDKASILQARLEELEDSLGIDEGRAEELEGLIGKVVRIKSNPGVPMTAAAFAGNGRVMCVWMDGDGYHEIDIPISALELVEQEGGQVGGKPSIDPILMRPIDDLGLNVRTMDRLKADNIFYIGDLIQLTADDLLYARAARCRVGAIQLTADDLLLGRKEVNYIKEALASRGLTLGMSLSDAAIKALEAVKGGAK